MRHRILFKPGKDGEPATGGGDPPAGGGDPKPPEGSGDPAPPTDPKPSTEKSFTEAEVEATVEKRLKRERKAWEAQLDKEKKKASMDEAERSKTEKKEAEDRAEGALKELDSARIEYEAKFAAMSAGAKPERVAQIMRLADLAEVSVTDGIPDAKGIETAIKTVKADLPELFGSTTPPRSGGDMGGGSQTPTFTRAQVKAMGPAEYEKNREAIMAATKAGRIVE